MPATRNTLGGTTSDGILDTLDSISTKLDAMASDNTQRDTDNATIIALLTAIDARLAVGIRTQVVVSL